MAGRTALSGTVCTAAILSGSDSAAECDVTIRPITTEGWEEGHKVGDPSYGQENKSERLSSPVHYEASPNPLPTTPWDLGLQPGSRLLATLYPTSRTFMSTHSLLNLAPNCKREAASEHQLFCQGHGSVPMTLNRSCARARVPYLY